MRLEWRYQEKNRVEGIKTKWSRGNKNEVV